LIFPLILSIEISSVTATIIGKIEDFFKKKAEPNQGWYGWNHVAEREVRRRVGKSPSEKRMGVSPSPNHPT